MLVWSTTTVVRFIDVCVRLECCWQEETVDCMDGWMDGRDCSTGGCMTGSAHFMAIVTRRHAVAIPCCQQHTTQQLAEAATLCAALVALCAAWVLTQQPDTRRITLVASQGGTEI